MVVKYDDIKPKAGVKKPASKTPAKKPASSFPENRPLAPQTPYNGPANVRRRRVVVRSKDEATGLTQEEHITYEDKYTPPAARERGVGSAPRVPGSSTPRNRNYKTKLRGPSLGGDSNNSGIGLLQLEFFLCIGLLILFLFANTSTDFTSKMMSVIKRGTLTCLGFFILALIAAIGPNAARVSKAIGALIVVALLLSTPAQNVNQDLDNLIKNDWAGTPHPADSAVSNSSSSSNTGNQSNATNSIPSSSAIQNAVNSFEAGLAGALAGTLGSTQANSTANTITNAVKGFLGGLFGSL